jgi:hypothetical protein
MGSRWCADILPHRALGGRRDGGQSGREPNLEPRPAFAALEPHRPAEALHGRLDDGESQPASRVGCDVPRAVEAREHGFLLGDRDADAGVVNAGLQAPSRAGNIPRSSRIGFVRTWRASKSNLVPAPGYISR